MLSAIFGAAVGFRNRLYDSGRAEQKRLQGPVVSIGNLSVGGTGKTPFTLMLGDLLVQRGVAFDVLSRGYRRQSSAIAVVDPNGNAREYGDEPLLMARHFIGKAQVIVGADRYQAGLLAEREFGPRLHLLDDGFQHRQLARDFDIVLLSADDSEQQLLPAGRLREPLSSLGRADAVVVFPGTDISQFPLASQQVWHVERDIVLPEDVKPVVRPLVFCGIARPERFFADLKRHGLEPVAEVRFRDHHRYTKADVERLAGSAAEKGADSFVTTEKDAMNLGQLAAELHSVFPAVVVRLKLSLRDAEEHVGGLLNNLKQEHG